MKSSRHPIKRADTLPSAPGIWRRLEEIISIDPGKRGIDKLGTTGSLRSASSALFASNRVGIVTGFFIPSAGKHETDGPVGCIDLANALTALDKVVYVISDPAMKTVFAGLTPHRVLTTVAACERANLDTLVSVERPGRAKTGTYHTMRGIDISAKTTPFDELFLSSTRLQTRIAVGDGGNEIGMGNVIDRVMRFIPLGETIGSVVPTDHLVVAGVSHWGAWGLVSGLSVLADRNLLPTRRSARHAIKLAADSGLVDGVSGKQSATIDGLPWRVHDEVLAKLRKAVVAPYNP